MDDIYNLETIILGIIVIIIDIGLKPKNEIDKCYISLNLYEISMNIADQSFYGPYSIDSNEAIIPNNRAAVYVVLYKLNGKYYVRDVGESGEVGIRLANHDRRSCWDQYCDGSPLICLRFMPTFEGYTAADRRKLESIIRTQYASTIKCGSR